MLTRRLPEPTVAMLTHAVVIASVAVLLLNDHLAKARWSGVMTGLASDVAGLVLAPVLAIAVIEVVHRRPLGYGGIATVVAVVAAGFAAVELVPLAAAAWCHGLGLVGAPVRWVISGTWSSAPAQATADPLDLLALPSAAAALLVRHGDLASACTPNLGRRHGVRQAVGRDPGPGADRAALPRTADVRPT